MDVIELDLRLTSLTIDGRRVPFRDGELLARRRLDAEGLAEDVTDHEHRSWSAWASAFNMYPVAGQVVIEARSRDGRRVTGPAWVTTTATPTDTYIEMVAVDEWIEGLGEGWDQLPPD